MPELIALYVDALDSAHIDPETTPNLHRWHERGEVAELTELFAFKGISAAMYGGVPPSESGVWMDFKVRTNPSPKVGDCLLNVVSRLPNELPRKGAVVAYERLIRDSKVTPHIVPGTLRPYFEAHPETPISDPAALGDIPTIFDLFRRHDISYKTIGLAGGPQSRLKQKARNAADYSEDVVLFKLTALDHVGHKHEPGSEKHRDELAEIDKILGDLAPSNGDYNLVVFSDHGMQPVVDTIDLRSLLIDDLQLQEEDDFVAFFNSTCALVRWLSDGVRERVISRLETVGGASLLSDKELARLHVEDTAKDFADDVIATRPGVVISPDFYRMSPPEGMHGFVENPAGGPIAVTPGQQLRDSGELWELPLTFLDSLSLPSPDPWKGYSLYK